MHDVKLIEAGTEDQSKTIMNEAEETDGVVYLRRVRRGEEWYVTVGLLDPDAWTL